jgi:hypothetical protein
MTDSDLCTCDAEANGSSGHEYDCKLTEFWSAILTAKGA